MEFLVRKRVVSYRVSPALSVPNSAGVTMFSESRDKGCANREQNQARLLCRGAASFRRWFINLWQRYDIFQGHFRLASVCGRSMQNISERYLMMCGGRTLDVGLNPIAASSWRKGLHQFMRVLTLTPAQSANCCFVIAFIFLVMFIGDNVYWLMVIGYWGADAVLLSWEFL